MNELSGRVALITGAGGGLGTSVTRLFLENGATVVAVSRTGPGVPEGESRFLSLRADLSTPEDANRAVGAALEHFKRLDIVLHLVGAFAGFNSVAETSDETWRGMFDVNLNTAFYMARAALRPMLGAKWGRFIATGSRTALEPSANFAAYGASKAALVALIRTMALELKGTGVTANLVLPSVIDTPANRAAMPAADFSKWVSPESIARLLLWLASGAAADVNGAAIPIYGAA